ncbi:unnamed protein product, partial [Hapterophycus canaliculatus]
MLSLREIGRTETIGNTSDPEFTKQFTLDFTFNEIQHVKVRYPRTEGFSRNLPSNSV